MAQIPELVGVPRLTYVMVMGAYGHSRIRSLVIGSTTEAMVRRCKVPVLMFR
jgi:nucleotide-binding universal stress UspA family protein